MLRALPPRVVFVLAKSSFSRTEHPKTQIENTNRSTMSDEHVKMFSTVTPRVAETHHECYVNSERFVLPKHYVATSTLGKGSYGTVVRGENVETKEKVAIKKNRDVFPKVLSARRSMNTRRTTTLQDPSLIPGENRETPHDNLRAMRLLREIKILHHLGQHPNVISILDLPQPESYENFTDIYIVNDLMPADLRDFLSSGETLLDDHIQYVMYQLLMAVSYMHSANIIHRDLKPDNILLASDCTIKVCDFGMARGIDMQNPKMSTSYVQTRWYRAPELLLNYKTVSKQVDMWSVGCILAELLGKKPLFLGNSPLQQIHLISKTIGTPKDLSRVKGSVEAVKFYSTMEKYPGIDFYELFPEANPLAIDLLVKMLQFDPDDRISAFEAMQHPYFKSIFYAEDMFVCDKFDFSYEDKCTSMEAIKEETFKMILEYNGLLCRRASLMRRPSQIMSDIQKDVIARMTRMEQQVENVKTLKGRLRKIFKKFIS
jgi:mitogen-activated protein kinase 1/3